MEKYLVSARGALEPQYPVHMLKWSASWPIREEVIGSGPAPAPRRLSALQAQVKLVLASDKALPRRSRQQF